MLSAVKCPRYRGPRAGSRVILLLIAAVVLSSSSWACSEKDKATGPEPEPSPYLAPTSPGNLLDNLITALEGRDIDAYSALFDEDEFAFRFDPVDLDGNPNLPEFWGYAGEVGWATNAFDSADVLRIDLAFLKGALVVPDSTEGVPESWRTITITGLELEVEAATPGNPTDNTIYKVSGDRGRFRFAPNPDVLVDGEPTWKIVEWQDIRVGARPEAALTIEGSFGRVKALFQVPVP